MRCSSRALGGVLLVGALGLAPAATASSGETSAVKYDTVVEFETDLAPPLTYGDTVELSGSARGVDPRTGRATVPLMAGTVTVYAWTSQNPTWVPIYTDPDSPGTFSVEVKPTANSQFKAVYSGGLWATSAGRQTYRPAESPVANLPMRRKIRVQDRSRERIRLRVKVTPGYGGKRLSISTRLDPSQEWTLFRRLLTNARGSVTFRPPSRRQRVLYVRLKARGDADYQATVFEGRVNPAA